MIWLLIAPLFVLLILFALSNKQEVALGLWPFDLTWEAPVSVAILLAASFAFLFGAGIVWLATMKYRGQVRALRERVRVLDAELAGARSRLAREVPPEVASRPTGTRLVALKRSAA
jgi:putative membrane protein